MDGSDALAGVQATFAAAAGAWLLLLSGEPGLARGSAVLAIACMGFLVWNWPPAKIFLGDVGSYFIGYSLAVLALAGEAHGALAGLVWVILLAPFIVDATATLIDRARRGERWYAAHRSHVYQLLIQAGWSHRRVAMTYLGLNLVVGLPAAYWAQAVPNQTVAAALAAICLISLAWFGLRAHAVKILGQS
jgi:Fuc2NAc and GlcNAc transferase